ncbi:MAG: hypothetical protein ACYCSN_19095 [Acidobacteriaceae bacterium]
MTFELTINKKGAILREGRRIQKLTHTEARALLADQDRKITGFHLNFKPQNDEDNVLMWWLRDFDKRLENGISPHGERVIVTVLPNSYFRPEGRDHVLHARFHARTESGKIVYDTVELEIKMENDVGRSNWVEIARSLLQCAESGASANADDEATLRTAVSLSVEEIEGDAE